METILRNLVDFAHRLPPDEIDDLKELLESSTVSVSVFILYIISLRRDYKHSIIPFAQVICSCECINRDELKNFLSQRRDMITIMFTTLSMYIYQYDRYFIQKFYCHWNEILELMTTDARSNGFINNAKRL